MQILSAFIVFAQQIEITLRASVDEILTWLVGVFLLTSATRIIGGAALREWDGYTVKEKIWALLFIAFGVVLWRYVIDLAWSAIKI